MNHKLFAVAAALALTFALASCGYNTGLDRDNRTVANDYTGRVDGVNEPFGARTSARGTGTGIFGDGGRYVAYPDGAVFPGYDATARDIRNAARDAELGVKNTVRGAGAAIDRMDGRVWTQNDVMNTPVS